MMFVKIVKKYVLDVNLNEVIKMKYSNTFSMVKSAVAKAIQNRNVKLIICCKNYTEKFKIKNMVSNISQEFKDNAIIISMFSAYFSNNSEIHFVNLSSDNYEIRGYHQIDDIYTINGESYSYSKHLINIIAPLNVHTYEE